MDLIIEIPDYSDRFDRKHLGKGHQKWLHWKQLAAILTCLLKHKILRRHYSKKVSIFHRSNHPYMKNSIFLSVSILIWLFSISPLQAQEEQTKAVYKPFKMDVGINLTLPTSADLTAGAFHRTTVWVNRPVPSGFTIRHQYIGRRGFYFTQHQCHHQCPNHHQPVLYCRISP